MTITLLNYRPAAGDVLTSGEKRIRIDHINGDWVVFRAWPNINTVIGFPSVLDTTLFLAAIEGEMGPDIVLEMGERG